MTKIANYLHLPTHPMSYTFMHTSKASIQQICGEFMKQHDLAFFGYIRVYPNMSGFVLSTVPEVFETLAQEHFSFVAPIPDNLLNLSKIYYVVPTQNNYEGAMHAVAQHYKLYMPIDFVFRHKNFSEIICYGVKQENPEIVNYYINHLAELEQFCQEFKVHAHSIIIQADRNKQFFPSYMHPILEKILSKEQRFTTYHKRRQYTVKINNKDVFFSQREKQCLEHLFQGKTNKQIADQLHITPQTVAAYLANIKYKTGIEKKQQMIQILYNQMFIEN